MAHRREVPVKDRPVHELDGAWKMAKVVFIADLHYLELKPDGRCDLFGESDRCPVVGQAFRSLYSSENKKGLLGAGK